VFHRVLLVQHHPDEQRERVVGQHLVGGIVAGDVDCHPPILPETSQTSYEPVAWATGSDDVAHGSQSVSRQP